MIVFHIYPVSEINVKSTAAVVLIVIGIVVLAYSGISFTTASETVQFLGMRIQTRETHFIPPLFGALALVGGIMMLLSKPRSA